MTLGHVPQSFEHATLGGWATALAAAAQGRELGGDTQTTWAELRWSAQHEGVTSLADAMPRRTRLGLLLPHGGEQVGAVCRDELGWDPARWQRERDDYAALIRRNDGVPSGTSTVGAAGAASTVTGSGPTGSPSA